MRRNTALLIFLVPLISTATLACDSDGAGTVAVEIWGEDFIEQAIPASEVADGWRVKYDHFVVTLGDITAAGASFPDAAAFDLTVPGPVAVTSGPATAGPIEPVAYSLVIPNSDTRNVNVEPDTFQTMIAEGWSVFVQGTATKDASTVLFSWGFDVTQALTDCHATARVPDGATGTTQITIHGDHLLYDSLVNPEAVLRFGPLADADADHDGEVTPAELAAVSGVTFGAMDNYDVPGGSGIDNLWDYLSAQARTIGHIDGEGHCEL